MPAYSNTYPPYSVGAGDDANVWSAETPAPGNGGASASAQVALVPSPAGGGAVHFDGKFSGAPGAFEVDCQLAALDVDGNYQTVANGNVTTADATNNTFHLEVITNAKFARMLMRTRTNAVSITGSIGR